MIDQDLLTEIQYALLEPPDGGASWPGEVWTRAEVLDGLNGGIRQLLRDTHLQLTWARILVGAGALSVALPADWLATAYLVWCTGALVRTPLGPVDSFEGDLALPSWETVPGTPIGFADLDAATLTLRLVPTPIDAGYVEILYATRPSPVTGAGEVLPVPDEFASGIKYAAIGWLLRKPGRLHDPERAAYCEGRYTLTQIAADLILGGWG
jgi:hypothetical protein